MKLDWSFSILRGGREQKRSVYMCVDFTFSCNIIVHAF